MQYRRRKVSLKGLLAGWVLGISLLSPLAAKSIGWSADALEVDLSSKNQLPPIPADVTELKFSEFFKMPIGPRGLEITPKLAGLNGHRVRILGFMVRQARPSPGVAILAPYSFTTSEGDYGLCDDLPPALIFVDVPKYRDIAVPFSPGPLLLTGRLELGARQEADGRVSYVRLILDPETEQPKQADVPMRSSSQAHHTRR